MTNVKNNINFRDLGGIKTSCGRKVRKNRLLRAAELVNLSDEEVAMLKDHDLTHIVDFRTSYETENYPDDCLCGGSYTHIDIMADVPGSADPNMWTKMLDSANVVHDMTCTYRGFITAESSRKGYGKFIKACIDTKEGAVLFHCAAGKDRTGVGAALVLKLLGVADEDIYADYLKSNEGRKAANKKLIEESRANGLTEDQLSALRTLSNVYNEFLDAAFDAIYAEYGCFDSYVEHGLGITSEEIKHLADLYLV